MQWGSEIELVQYSNEVVSTIVFHALLSRSRSLEPII